MTFLNSALLAGLGAVAIPVLLHFLLKQRPKKLLFPALKLIEQRRKQSVRRLRLRHFWLMLLRMLALAAIVFALARPSLPPANYNLSRMEMFILFSVVAFGVGIFFWWTHRIRKSDLSRYEQSERQSTARVRTTVGTLIAVLLLVGIPYQQRLAAELTDTETPKQLDIPVAGIMLFDTSLSMDYLRDGKTSLDQAKEIALNHLGSLPTGSKVAISDNGSDNPVLFQSTILSARTRIDSLATSNVSVSLNDRLRDALRAQDDDQSRTLSDQASVEEAMQKDRYIRRIYLLTDLAKTGWREKPSSMLTNELERLKNINIYVIDVGQERPENLAVMDVQLSRERIPLGGDLIVSSSIASFGHDLKDVKVDLLLTDIEGNSTRHGEQTISLDAGIPLEIEFPVVTNLTKRIVHGEVRLSETDALSFDNQRRFSAEVSPPPKVLVVAPNRNMANEWMTALAPHFAENAGKNTFRPEFAQMSQIAEMDLTNFAMVTLINLPRVKDDLWFQLSTYVESGGGLVVVLGNSDVKPATYNRAQAQSFLPAELHSWQTDGDRSFNFTDRSHPMFWKFRHYENYGAFAIVENDVVVRRYFKVIPAEGANVLATYTDPGSPPAIIERAHGRGRTVMLTTAVDLPDNYRQRWSNLASPLVSEWHFVAFAEQMAEYVSRFTDLQHNFIAGDKPTIQMEGMNVARSFLLREPELRQSRRNLPAGESQLLLKNLDQIGHYELTDAESQQAVGGFTINPLAAESDPTRLEESELDAHLGEERYQLARDIDELKDDINASDLGQEVYPMLLMLLVVIFCGEHLVANRFYQQEQAAA